MSEQDDLDDAVQAAYDRGYDRGYDDGMDAASDDYDSGYDAGYDTALNERGDSKGTFFLDGYHLFISKDGAYRIIDTRTGEDDGIRFTLPSTARGYSNEARQ